MIDSKRIQGSSIIIVQSIGIAFTGMFAKMTEMKGMPAFQILALQALVAIIILIPWLFRLKKPKIGKSDLVVLVIRATAGILCTGALFYSFQGVSLTTALLLFNTGPLFVPFVLWMTGSKSLSLEIIIYISLGFLGIFLILDPHFQDINHYYIAALFSGIFSSIVAVSTRKISQRNLLDFSVLTLLPCHVLVFSLLAIPFWTPISLELLPLIIGAGIFWALVQICFVGFKFACASLLAPLLFFSVVVSSFLDWYVWHQAIRIETVLGIVFVVFASVLVITHD